MAFSVMTHLREGLFPNAVLMLEAENSLTCLWMYTKTNNVYGGKGNDFIVETINKKERSEM
jgi:hypothetical protein